MATLSTAGKNIVGGRFAAYYSDAGVALPQQVTRPVLVGSTGVGEFDTSFNTTWGTDPGASFSGGNALALSDAKQSRLLVFTMLQRFTDGIVIGSTLATSGKNAVVAAFCTHYSNTRESLGSVTKAELVTAVGEFDAEFVGVYTEIAAIFSDLSVLSESQAANLVYMIVDQRHTEFYT